MKMRILVSGASGLVGRALTPFLEKAGHEVTPLVRGPAQPGVRWDPSTGIREMEAAEGFDAVVHLAGENIAQGRWNAAKKFRIRGSRVDGTRSLAASLASLSQPPGLMVCASAIGYYGDRGAISLDETASPGEGYLPEVCREWEAAAGPAASNGIRVVHLRLGVVLSPDGGALVKMLLPFKMGVGGKVGDGRQYMSWVSIDDVVGIIGHTLERDDLRGPVNAVAPDAVTNAEFTSVLARVLSRPAFFPMPAFAARLAFGEMADALLLASTRVTPARLLESGYEFQHSNLESALRHLLGR